jgi:hypothetical protein
MMMNQFKGHTGHQRIKGMGKAKMLLRCGQSYSNSHQPVDL